MAPNLQVPTADGTRAAPEPVRLAVNIPPVPPWHVIVGTSCGEYPDPGFVIVIAVTAPTLAAAVSPEPARVGVKDPPVPPAHVIVGSATGE